MHNEKLKTDTAQQKYETEHNLNKTVNLLPI